LKYRSCEGSREIQKHFAADLADKTLIRTEAENLFFHQRSSAKISGEFFGGVVTC
jgi:hypothetical protein